MYTYLVNDIKYYYQAMYQKWSVLLSKHSLKRLNVNRVLITTLQQSSAKHNILKTPIEQKNKKSFISMTRKTLIHKLMENKHLVSAKDKEVFLDFSLGLESSISHDFHKVLMEMKVLRVRIFLTSVFSFFLILMLYAISWIL